MGNIRKIKKKGRKREICINNSMAHARILRYIKSYFGVVRKEIDLYFKQASG